MTNETLSEQKTPVEQEAAKKDVIRDNAPRIVGALKFVPDTFLFISGLQEVGKMKFRSAAAAAFMGARTMLLAFGSKDRKPAEGQKESPYKDDNSFTGKIKHNFYKVTHPSQYPVESGAGIATVAGALVAASGASLMRQKGKRDEGAIELGVGIATALAEGNVLFGKEKPKPADTAEASKDGKAKDLVQKLKDQPVFLSGIAQAAISGSQVILGAMKYARSKKNLVEGEKPRWQYLAAASIYTGADLVYAFFVRKNEFNTEAKASKAPPLHSEDTSALSAELKNPGRLFTKDAPKANWEQAVQQSAKKDNAIALN